MVNPPRSAKWPLSEMVVLFKRSKRSCYYGNAPLGLPGRCGFVFGLGAFLWNISYALLFERSPARLKRPSKFTFYFFVGPTFQLWRMAFRPPSSFVLPESKTLFHILRDVEFALRTRRPTNHTFLVVQKLILFNRGKAISGAPIIIGTNQLPKPPIKIGITIKKIIIKA